MTMNILIVIIVFFHYCNQQYDYQQNNQWFVRWLLVVDNGFDYDISHDRVLINPFDFFEFMSITSQRYVSVETYCASKHSTIANDANDSLVSVPNPIVDMIV